MMRPFESAFRRPSGVLSLALLALSAGCGAQDASDASSESGDTVEDSKEGGLGVARECIQGGGPQPEYLLLDGRQQNAIVQLHLSGGDESVQFSGTCSGVLVRDRWVLTAAHCTQDPETTIATVQFGAARTPSNGQCAHGAPLSPGLPSKRLIAHPSLDLMLVELEESPATYVDVTPIPIGAELPRVGALVELAGFGWTEDSPPGLLRFAVEPVSELADEHIVVDGKGRSGACTADSGGPLLARDHQGLVVALGVLEKGSSSCLGLDRYVRADLAEEWLRAELPEAGEQSTSCGALSAEGRCFGDVAAWCADGELRSASCASGELCAFDAAAGGYRCTGEPASECGATTDLGECRENLSVICAGGQLQQASCQECVRSTTSGKATCLDT